MPLVWLTLTMLATAAPSARPPRGASVFDMVVVAGIGPRRIEEQTILATDCDTPRLCEVATIETHSVWDDPGGPVRFDSTTPSTGAPWPLITQHAVASTPATIAMSRSGSAHQVVDPDQWQTRARAALDGLALPAEGRRSGEALVDPEGLIRDLQRTFVGTPEAVWVRADRLAGVDVEREEACTTSRDGAVTTWACRGTATPVAAGAHPLHDGETWTRVQADKRGLLEVEEGWSGTLVHLARDGQTLTDSPIGGRRLVRRR